MKNTPANATVGFNEGQKILVEEMIQEEEKKLKKIKPLWKVSRHEREELNCCSSVGR